MDDKKQWTSALSEKNFLGFELAMQHQNRLPEIKKTTPSEQALIQERDKLKANLLPCPFCGGKELGFKYSTSHGHGDSGFDNFRLLCKCGGAKGNISNYGRPTIQDEIEIYKQWNLRTQ